MFGKEYYFGKMIYLNILVVLFYFNYCVDASISLKKIDDGFALSVTNDAGQITLEGTIGIGQNYSTYNCSGSSENLSCTIDSQTTFEVREVDSGYRLRWTAQTDSADFKDCFNLNVGSTYWFGGPERYVQKPLEQLVMNGSDPYVIKKTDNFAVAERYWLNSKGTFIFIHDKIPLFVDQNNEQQGLVCFYARSQNPYINRKRTILHYDIVTKNNSKEAHLFGINNYLGKPTGRPNDKMIKGPIWTSWPKYKKYIDQQTIRDFAQSIADNKFDGILEIDEDWEVCFGSHVFNKDKFPDIQDTVSFIRNLGFNSVTLWINPFVNNDCQNYSTEGLDKGYFVKDPDGNTKAIWWESDDAHQVDFTNPNASEWFASKVRALAQDPGMDGFKFDAGETDYAIPPSQFDWVEDQEEVPNIFTKKYIETCAEFGDMIEVRSAWRTQNLPMFIRMIDKDSIWGDDDGLYSLVTTLIQMNMNGYSMVLPDMVGGNGYRQQPTAELIVRWTQANALMPALQFGYLPWDFPSDSFNTTEIARKFTELHFEYTDEIIAAMEASISNGTPVNPPIWWIDPTDVDAFAISDEFLLGEKILVAPVLFEGATSRNIYLPKGSWKDGNSGTVYQGPLTISNYTAPIDVLPYFILQD